MRRSLAQATGQLRPDQLLAIAAVVRAADGNENIDDLAFASQILVELMTAHDETPAGWAIVAAHKALLEMAVDEGIIDDLPRRGRVQRRLRHLLAEANQGVRTLNDELDRVRRMGDNESRALRAEIATLRAELARRDEDAEAVLRQREEDQRRRDELDRYPGAGAG